MARGRGAEVGPGAKKKRRLEDGGTEGVDMDIDGDVDKGEYLGKFVCPKGLVNARDNWFAHIEKGREVISNAVKEEAEKEGMEECGAIRAYVYAVFAHLPHKRPDFDAYKTETDAVYRATVRAVQSHVDGKRGDNEMKQGLYHLLMKEFHLNKYKVTTQE